MAKLKSKKKQKRNKYPWDRWFTKLEVTMLALYHHQDFNCQIHGMAQQIRNAAAKRRLQVSLTIHDKSIEVRLV